MVLLKVVFPSEDGVNIFNGHPGDSKKFYLYEVGKNDYKLLKEVENTVRDEEHEHAHEGKLKKILKLLGEVNIMASKRMSPNLLNMAKKTKVQPILYRNAQRIEDYIKKIQENFEKISEFVSLREKGEYPELLRFE